MQAVARQPDGALTNWQELTSDNAPFHKQEQGRAAFDPNVTTFKGTERDNEAGNARQVVPVLVRLGPDLLEEGDGGKRQVERKLGDDRRSKARGARECAGSSPDSTEAAMNIETDCPVLCVFARGEEAPLTLLGQKLKKVPEDGGVEDAGLEGVSSENLGGMLCEELRGEESTWGQRQAGPVGELEQC